MARSKREWQFAKFERYLKEGRGQGEGKTYVPWIQIHDFPFNYKDFRATIENYRIMNN
ncbi:MAG: hypothetical protein AB4080_11425 [Trichodesmium sp.]